MEQVAGETIRQIERGMRDPPQRYAERHARFRLLERLDCDGFVGGVVHRPFAAANAQPGARTAATQLDGKKELQ